MSHPPRDVRPPPGGTPTGAVPGGATRRLEPPAARHPARGRSRARVPDARPAWPRVLIVLGALLMALSCGSLAGMRVLLDRYTGSVHQQRMLGDAAVAPGRGPALVGALNLLLVGVDERTVEADPQGTLADSIIILHVNAAHDQAYLLSVPRDTLADIPPFPGTGFPGGPGKINAAFRYGGQAGAGRAGGFELLAAAVRGMTGISFNAGAIVNFAGFRAAVEVLGGLDLCVDERVTSVHLNTRGGDITREGGQPAVYQPGCGHLEPWQALDYARQRYGLPGADYDRQRHQQQMIKAIARQAVNRGMSDPAVLDKVLTAAGRALTVDVRGATLVDWLLLLRGIGTGGLVMLKTNGGEFAPVTCPDGSSCEQLTATSVQMFEAARTDTLDQFVVANPAWVAADGT